MAGGRRAIAAISPARYVIRPVTIRCAWIPGGVDGLTEPWARRITIEPKPTAQRTRLTLVHELSHMYSIDRLTSRQRVFFARKVNGSIDFWGGSHYVSPAEVWAVSMATCHGYPDPNPRYRRVSCATITATIRSPRGG